MPSCLIWRHRRSGEQAVPPVGGLGFGADVKLHWGLGKQHWKKGGTIRWLTACGRWLPLRGFAPWGKHVTCEKCRAYLTKVAAS